MTLLEIINQRQMQKEAAKLPKLPKIDDIKAVAKKIMDKLKTPNPKYVPEVTGNKAKDAYKEAEAWVMNNPKKSSAVAGGLGLTTGATAAISAKRGKKKDK